ncbi:MAG TPA: HEAT repeat domain-containing protein [Candidatus Dormibacteraeota bacterium]|nr:HEAT repeat domain-containing protein [Candidatus Dormibacteraeota bacterium]
MNLPRTLSIRKIIITFIINMAGALVAVAQAPTPTPSPARAQEKPAQPQQQPAPKPQEEPSAKPNAPAAAATPAVQPTKKRKPEEKAWDILKEGFADDKTDKRAKAVKALSLLPGNADAEKMAKDALKDEKHSVRVAAAMALGSMRAVGAKTELESALEDKEPAVVLAAANSLLQLKDNAGYDVYYEVLTGNMRTNKGLIKEQFRQLQDKRKMAELGIEEGLGFLPFVGFGYTVAKTVIKDDSSPVRAAAAKKLATDPDPITGEALANAVRDKSWLVRAAALEAIAQRGNRALVPKILVAMNDPKDEVRYTAAACVAHLISTGKRRTPKPATPRPTAAPAR